MYKDKKILVVIPARGGSKGIKHKNLRTVKGIPMVGLVGEVIKNIAIIDRSVVSTDHEEIANVAEEYGISAPFRRPKYLSGDRIGDLEVLTHALETIEKTDQCTYDIIVMLQPTSPLRTREHIEQTITKLIDENLDATWTISETDSKGHPLKQLTLNNDLINYYDKNGAQIIARQQLTPVYHRNGAAYAITRKCLLDQKTIMGEKTGAILVKEPMISIDTEFDIELVEFFIDKRVSA